ncbi:hypothetical protein BDZ89DRAFT_1140808 [Hymenopellis radicata]|nr:hypothetical protein BDZ89DRAFT_1140808 [Hymenopellis radicata]
MTASEDNANHCAARTMTASTTTTTMAGYPRRSGRAQCLEPLNIFANDDDADQRVGHAPDNCEAGMVAATGVVLASDHQEKLPIYRTQTPEILLQETPSALEKPIQQVRKTITQTYGDAHAQVQGIISKCIGVEHPIENHVKSLISPTERVTSGILYIVIATLSALSLHACGRVAYFDCDYTRLPTPSLKVFNPLTFLLRRSNMAIQYQSRTPRFKLRAALKKIFVLVIVKLKAA